MSGPTPRRLTFLSVVTSTGMLQRAVQTTEIVDQHNKGLDLQTVERLVRWNADTDLKRRLVNVRDVGGLIAAETVPWRTIEEFEVERDTLDMWRAVT
jgi:hypothetical protein